MSHKGGGGGGSKKCGKSVTYYLTKKNSGPLSKHILFYQTNFDPLDPFKTLNTFLVEMYLRVA
jgi:hypothetical protein